MKDKDWNVEPAEVDTFIGLVKLTELLANILYPSRACGQCGDVMHKAKTLLYVLCSVYLA